MYKLILKTEDDNLIVHDVAMSNDDELFMALGHFSAWYFLALDSIDYKDAYWGGKGSEIDALLKYTCEKPERDRHRLPRGKLAYGYAWVPQKAKVLLCVEEL